MRMLLRLGAVVLTVFLLGACGGDPPLDLSAAGATGRDIANANGCASCHGKNGQGVTAPAWQGRYLSDVELDGGTTVVADEEYLYRAITDPQAEIVKGWTIKMPQNTLDDAQIASIIDYIKELR